MPVVADKENGLGVGGEERFALFRGGAGDLARLAQHGVHDPQVIVGDEGDFESIPGETGGCGLGHPTAFDVGPQTVGVVPDLDAFGFLVPAGAEHVEIEKTAENDRRAVLRKGGEKHGIVVVERELFLLARLQVVLPEVEIARLLAGIIEPFPVRHPEGVTAFDFAFGMEPGEVLRRQVEDPDLAGARADIPLAIRRGTLAGKQDALSVGRDGAFGGVAVEKQLLTLVSLCDSRGRSGWVRGRSDRAGPR